MYKFFFANALKIIWSLNFKLMKNIAVDKVKINFAQANFPAINLCKDSC